jgi:hypothetical protein
MTIYHNLHANMTRNKVVSLLPQLLPKCIHPFTPRSNRTNMENMEYFSLTLFYLFCLFCQCINWQYVTTTIYNTNSRTYIQARLQRCIWGKEACFNIMMYTHITERRMHSKVHTSCKHGWFFTFLSVRTMCTTHHFFSYVKRYECVYVYAIGSVFPVYGCIFSTSSDFAAK